MRRTLPILFTISLAAMMSSCSILGGRGNDVDVRKPRLHKTWPKKHKWHKKVKVWKFTLQMPERGGVKKRKMKS